MLLIVLLVLGWLVLYGCMASWPRSSRAQERFRMRAGRAGEAKVTRVLRTMVHGTSARLLVDVTLPTAYGGTTQIDHILITQAGIVVIEVKHWAGTIQAEATAERWKQSALGMERWLQNPLHQNGLHLRAVRLYLASCFARAGILAYLVTGLVVCTGSAQPVGSWPSGVGDLDWLRRTLAGRQRHKLLDAAMIARCAACLEAHRLPPGRRTDQRHIRQVRRRYG
jgi:restriction system protein